MKCRTKREMKDTKAITMKNGKPATQGVCPVCGTKMFRMGRVKADSVATGTIEGLKELSLTHSLFPIAHSKLFLADKAS